MALLDTFKQRVLSLGRSEARAKARPLLAGGESFERSAAGLDRRASEQWVLFWLLSDRALYLVAGGGDDDWAFRIPYDCVDEMFLEFDENAETFPWHVRLAVHAEGDGEITTLGEAIDPGNPLGPPLPRVVDPDERARLAAGDIIPVEGYAIASRKFRSALARHLAASEGRLRIRGEDKAEAQRRLRSRKRTKQTD